MNKIVENLLIQSYNDLKFSFQNTKNVFTAQDKIIHPAEYGKYREELLKKWLKIIIANRYGIGHGFVISPSGDVSTECDIIIYDKLANYNIEGVDGQRFFPVEIVLAIGEVKSDIQSIAELNSYLVKLAKNKKLREGVKFPDPVRREFDQLFNPNLNSFDNIFSFLICNKFNFKKFSVEDINYGNIPVHFWHNCILSLEDGIITYKARNAPNIPMPMNNGIIHNKNYIKTDGADLPCHIKIFLTHLHQAMNLTTILSVDIATYISDQLIESIS